MFDIIDIGLLINLAILVLIILTALAAMGHPNGFFFLAAT